MNAEYIESERYKAIVKVYLKLEKEHLRVIEKCVNDKLKLQKRLIECQEKKKK